MYDMHYDLLTILYCNYMNQNKYSDLGKMIDELQKIYRENNIYGGIINLYFMSEEEMYSKLDISKNELSNIPLMFKKSINFLDNLNELDIIPHKDNFIYEINGCDYLNIEDLEELKEIGLRIIAPVSTKDNNYVNNLNLTNKGIELIEKSIDLGIAIDISNTSTKVFNDILDIAEIDKKKDPKIFTNSIINSKDLERLNSINGYIYIDLNSLSNKKELLNIIKETQKILDVDRIMIGSNNKTYLNRQSLFIEYNLNTEVRSILKEEYDSKLINKLLLRNPKEFITKIKEKKSRD